MMGTPQTVALLLSVNPLLAAGLVVLLVVVEIGRASCRERV